MKKILLIQLGDRTEVILSTPLVRLLKTQLDAQVHCLTYFPEVFEENPYLDMIVLISGRIYDLGIRLRKNHYDVVIDLSNSLTSTIIRWIAGAVTTLVIRERKFNMWLMTRFKINRLESINRTEQFIRAARSLEVKPDAAGVDIFIPDKDHVEENWLPPEFKKGYAVLSLHASYGTRKIPLNKVVELCDRINKPILLIGENEDQDLAKALESFFEKRLEAISFEAGLKKLNKKTFIFNAVGKFNFHQLASVIKGAKYVFSCDSEIAHMASALKKKLFIIWGNTVPIFGYYPYNGRFTILENNKVECRPCSTSGYSKCPRKHFDCMNKIVFDFYLP